MKIVRQDHPARSTAKRVPRAFELRLPRIVTAEELFDRGEHISRRLSVAAEIQLARMSGPVVTNISTTAAIDAIAARHGASVIRTPVGQAFVSEAMLENGGVIGNQVDTDKKK